MSSVDVLIVGAGIYGAAAAYEATRRGHHVLLVDRDDIAGGASSNSMKTAHGGLRYLQSLDLRRCFESVRERRRLLLRAPDLVVPQAFGLALEGRGTLYRSAFRAGLLLNDALTIRRNRGVRHDRRIERARYPSWQDARIEDTERLILALLHTAASRCPGGLEVVTHDGVAQLLEDDGPNGRVRGAVLESGRRVECDAVLRCTGGHQPGARSVLAVNLVVSSLPIGKPGEATVLFHPDDGRNLFVSPWRGRSIIGTLNREFDADPMRPLELKSSWVDEFLEWVRPVHPALASLGREHVRLVHAGLLPAEPTRTGPEPAHHFRLERTRPGLLDVIGVKWTTAWGVAERAVGMLLGGDAVPDDQPLDDGRALREKRIRERPGTAQPVSRGCSAPRIGDIEFAVDCEWAVSLSDILLRRTGGASAGHPGRAISAAVADVAQPMLDWSARERLDQLEAFDGDPRFAGNVPS